MIALQPATALTRSGADLIIHLLERQGVLMSRIDALGGWDWQHRVETVLTHLGVAGWDRPVAGLSGGERKRTTTSLSFCGRNLPVRR